MLLNVMCAHIKSQYDTISTNVLNTAEFCAFKSTCVGVCVLAVYRAWSILKVVELFTVI